jgi:uncharacterized protein YbbK (DUF523 family)
MPSPRSPSEIVGSGGGLAVVRCSAIVKNQIGEDVTSAYRRGAELAVSLARQHGIKIAILKEGSPSCGSNKIYDGTFSGKVVPGMGLTATMLVENGV